VQHFAREQLLASLDPARTAGDPAGDGGQTAAVERAVEALRTFTQDQRLPAMARSLLERALAEVGDLDPQNLGANVERLREMAERFAGSDLAARVAELGLSALDQEQLRGLWSTLRDAGSTAAERSASGDAGRARHEPGREGDTGGDAAGNPSAAAPSRAAPVPRFHEPVAGGAPQEFVLPEGQPALREWLPIGSMTVEPTVAPAASAPSGAAAPAGSGGAVWQLQVAPRHRAIVQRFFAADDSGTTKERR